MTIGHTTPAGISVLDDLGLDRGFTIKAKLAIRIQKTVEELGLNQRDAARQMGISQPKLSQLTRGKFDGLSQAKLENVLSHWGMMSSSTSDHAMRESATGGWKSGLRLDDS